LCNIFHNLFQSCCLVVFNYSHETDSGPQTQTFKQQTLNRNKLTTQQYCCYSVSYHKQFCNKYNFHNTVLNIIIWCTAKKWPSAFVSRIFWHIYTEVVPVLFSLPSENCWISIQEDRLFAGPDLFLSNFFWHRKGKMYLLLLESNFDVLDGNNICSVKKTDVKILPNINFD